MRVDLEDAADLEPCVFHEFPDLALEAFRPERFELEKKRFDHKGGEVHDEDAEGQEERPDPEPPPCRAEADDGKGARHDNPSQDRGNHGRLDQVGDLFDFYNRSALHSKFPKEIAFLAINPQWNLRLVVGNCRQVRKSGIKEHYDEKAQDSPDRADPEHYR